MRPRIELLKLLQAQDYEAFMRLAVGFPQEHPGLGTYGFRQDDVDQGADPGDPER